MEYVIEILSQLNFVQLIALALLIWFFNGRLENRFNKRIDEVRDELRSSIKNTRDVLGKDIKDTRDDLGRKIEKLDEKVTDIDRRLCRLEGAFSNKDCCMIKDDRQVRKAE